MRQVKAPRSQSVRETLRDHDRAFTREQRDQLIAVAYALAAVPSVNPRTIRKRRATADLIALLAGTGMRIDEARSLRWKT